MTKSTSRKKRNKLAVALLAPILVFIFIVGWSLSWIGQLKANQPQKPINKTCENQNEVELIMIDQEKQILAK
jgi:hypothetical protein